MDCVRKAGLSIGVMILIVLVIVVGVFLLFHYAYKGTPDSKRINTTTNVKIVVNLPGMDSSPSKAITDTYSAKKYNTFTDTKKYKLKMRTTGRVEGDIPCVYTKNKEKSKIEVQFQDLKDKDIVPTVKSIQIYRYTWPPQESLKERKVDLPFGVNNGRLTFYATDFAEAEALEKDAENGVFEIRYVHDEEEYVSLFALNVCKDESNPFEE